MWKIRGKGSGLVPGPNGAILLPVPRFPRPTIKRLRVNVSSDGRITPIPAGLPPVDEDSWWDSVVNDPRARRKPLDYDTLGFNKDDTADVSCSDCHLSRALPISDLLVMGFKPEAKVNDAIADFVRCQRSAKRCRLGYRLRQARR